MSKVVAPGNMTKVERGDLLPSGHLTQGTDMMRRSRSLSELPGHHRVPILKRKDTERTQARLEAGDAGVKELRALRQQQQQLMELALAQHKKSRFQTRQVTETGDQSSHRPSEQLISGHVGHHVYEPNIVSSMSLYSSNSLASITEELATKGQAMKQFIPNGAVTPAQLSPQLRSQKQSQSLQHESIIRYPQQTQQSVYSTQQGHAMDAVHPKCQLLKGYHSMAPLNTHVTAEKHHAKPANRNLSRRCYSSSQDFLVNEPLKSGVQFMPNPIPSSMPISSELELDHRRSVVQLQSDQRFARGRTQSVHESFYYFPFVNNEIKKDHSLNAAQKLHDNVTNSKLNKSRSKNDLSSCYDDGDLNQQINQLSGTLTSFCNQSLHGDTMAAPSPRNKSISWDELLVTIGLNNNTKNVTSNSTIENANHEKSEATENGHIAAVEREQNFETSGVEKVIKKSGRSQSFTSGTLHFHNSPTEDPDCVQKVHNPNEHVSKFFHGHRQASSQPRQRYTKLTAGHHNSAALSRRPSIQSEAVITRNDPLRKILNPLHEVDMKSMNVPGPLHAVTLQYSGLHGRKFSQSELFPSTLSPMTNQGSNLSGTEIQIMMSEVTQSTSVNHDNSLASKELQTQNHASTKWDNTSPNNSDPTQVNKATKGQIEPKQKHSSKEQSSRRLKNSSEDTGSVNKTQNTLSATQIVRRSLFPNTKNSIFERKDQSTVNSRSSLDVFDMCVSGGPQNVAESNADDDDIEISPHGTCATIEEENDDMLEGFKGKIKLSPTYSNFSVENTNEVKSENICEQNEQKVGSIIKLAQNGKRFSLMSSNKDRKLKLEERSERCSIGNLGGVGESERMEQRGNLRQELSNVKLTYSSGMTSDLNELGGHRSENKTLPLDKLDNQLSCHCPSSPSRPIHTSDITVCLDEGYNTCDSVSPKWQVNKHGLHSSDNSSLSSGSVSNVSALGDGLFSPHDTCNTSKEKNPPDVFRHNCGNYGGLGKAQALAYSRNSSVCVTISEADSVLLESACPDSCKTKTETIKDQGIFTNTLVNVLHSQCVKLAPENSCAVDESSETTINTPLSPSVQDDRVCLQKADSPPKLPFKQTAV